MKDAKNKTTNWTSLLLLLIFLFPVMILGNIIRIVTQTNLESQKTGSTLLPFFGEKIEYYVAPGSDSQIQVLSEKTYLIPSNEQEKTTNVITQFADNGKLLVTTNKNSIRNSVTYKSVLWEVDADGLRLQKELTNQHYFDTDNNLYQLNYQLLQETKESGKIKLDIVKDGITKSLERPIVIPNTLDYSLNDLPVISGDKKIVSLHFKNLKNDLQPDIIVFLNISANELIIKSLKPHQVGYLNQDGTKYSFYDLNEKAVFIHNLETKAVDRLETDIETSSFASKDGKYYVSGTIQYQDASGRESNDPNQVVSIINSQTLETETEIMIFMRQQIRNIIPINDNIVMVVNDKGVINFLDLKTQGVIRTITNPKFKGSDEAIHFYYNSISLSPNKQKLTAVDTENTVYIWPISINN